MTYFHIHTLEVHLYTLKRIYGPVLSSTVETLVENAPESYNVIYSELKIKFPNTSDLEQQLKYILAILFQIGLIAYQENKGECYYSLNYDTLQEKLLIPGIILHIDTIASSVDRKKLITILLNYGELTETQIRSFSHLSEDDFMHSKAILERDRLIKSTSYYHNLLNRSINFYKINIFEIIKRFSFEQVRKHYKTILSDVEFRILEAFLDSDTHSIPLNGMPRAINKKFNTIIEDENIYTAVLSLQRHNEILFGDFKMDSINSHDTLIYSHKSALQFIIDDMVISSLIEECGKKAGRVMSYMLKKDCYVEEYIVSEDCCLPYKETKTIIVYLWKNEYVEKEEITKKKDPMNEQVLYVFYANKKSVYETFERNIKHALLKCYKCLEVTTDASKIKVLNSCIIDFITNLMIIHAWKNENDYVFKRQDRRMSQ